MKKEHSAYQAPTCQSVDIAFHSVVCGSPQNGGSETPTDSELP